MDDYMHDYKLFNKLVEHLRKENFDIHSTVLGIVQVSMEIKKLEAN